MAVQDAPAAYVSLTTWSDLDEALWRKVASFLTMNDSVKISGTCYGMLENTGGFAELQDVSADYWRLLDHSANIQQQEAEQQALGNFMDEWLAVHRRMRDTDRSR